LQSTAAIRRKIAADTTIANAVAEFNLRAIDRVVKQR